MRGKRRFGRGGAALAGLMTVALLATACGDDGGDGNGNGGGDAGGTGSAPAAGGETNLTMGYINWDENIVTAHLWKQELEKKGYTVELQQLDAAALYAGLGAGDIDVFMDAWLPNTHADYWEQYGDQLEDIGVWYDQASLELTVPEYVDADSIEDLKGRGDEFNGQIIGIEPSAGISRLAKDEVIPTYGLDDFTLLESSTPAMLADLEAAIEAEEPVVVTLWHPHWAYNAMELKDLEDPEGAFGEAEELHTLGREGFTEDFPEVAAWMENFTIDDETLASLEDVVLNEYGAGQEAEGVAAWTEENSEYVTGLTS